MPRLAGMGDGSASARPQQSEDTGDPRNGRAWGPGTEELLPMSQHGACAPSGLTAEGPRGACTPSGPTGEGSRRVLSGGPC